MTAPASHRDTIAAFVPTSPLARHLGIAIDSLGDDEAVLVLPFRDEICTMGDVVHGGAISALADTAAMCAAWATDDPVTEVAGATITLTVHYVAAARGADVHAHARVTRRGGRLNFVHVDVTAGERLVATASAVYQVGK